MDFFVDINSKFYFSGPDSSDATCSRREADDFVSALKHASTFSSTPLQGKKVAVIKETIGAGVDAAVNDTLSAARAHLESLGAVADEVSLPTFATGLPAYYVIALSEASSNLARYDGVRYGERIAGAAGKQNKCIVANNLLFLI